MFLNHHIQMSIMIIITGKNCTFCFHFLVFDQNETFDMKSQSKHEPVHLSTSPFSSVSRVSHTIHTSVSRASHKRITECLTNERSLGDFPCNIQCLYHVRRCNTKGVSSFAVEQIPGLRRQISCLKRPGGMNKWINK